MAQTTATPAAQYAHLVQAPFGLIGEHLSHSKSAPLHAQLVPNIDYRYIELAPEALAPFLAQSQARGLNVTIPYKEAVLPLCQSLTPRAKLIGAVNTLTRQADGSWMGDNTDVLGLVSTLEHLGVAVDGATALIVGTGGAAKCAYAALREMGARRIAFLSRNPARDQAQLAHFGARLAFEETALDAPDVAVLSAEAARQLRDVRILINATPVGMYPHMKDEPVVSLSDYPALSAVVDMIYNPVRTNLLLEAKRLGIAYDNGYRMLVGQAAYAQKNWLEAAGLNAHSVTAPETLHRVYESMMRLGMSITLIGMPGAGKTTIGRQLAAALQLPFVDTDECFEARHGSIEHYIQTQGIEAFRTLENAIIDEVSQVTTPRVIATGGGSVLNPDNARALMRLGPVIHLRRDLDQLEVAGRPLSQRVNLTTLWQTRAPIYFATQDIETINRDNPTSTVVEILIQIKNFIHR